MRNNVENEGNTVEIPLGTEPQTTSRKGEKEAGSNFILIRSISEFFEQIPRRRDPSGG